VCKQLRKDGRATTKKSVRGPRVRIRKQEKKRERNENGKSEGSLGDLKNKLTNRVQVGRDPVATGEETNT